MNGLAAVGVAIVLVLTGTACNEGDDEGGSFSLELAGDAEVCEGDTCGGDGAGTAEVTINSDQNEICYEIALDGVQDVTAAHIHAAPEGEAGDVVVDLDYAGDDAGAEGCVDGIDESILEEVSEEPGRHYLNVHSEEYPDGAARAQLES
ncbi:MAG TPA: CHRD domain-containing protein [Actinomycetota bacterium]|nr:CHRD domain-containing protein [Actinomycetota bacterium]